MVPNVRGTEMIWLVESGVFDKTYNERMARATSAVGHRLVQWDDGWWDAGLPMLDNPVVFHGSLGNAHAVRSRIQAWKPGAFCATDAFHCSVWYPRAKKWLLHRRYEVLAANQLVAEPRRVFDLVGADGQAFFRPDSPLKPFSGRVLALDALNLAALDHGFYYDDEQLPVVVAPIQSVGQEWRFVVVDGTVVAGSGYLADGRKAVSQAPDSVAWQFAVEVASEMEPPELVYVLDVCETPEGLRLLELNPFSGADLYACDLQDIVAEVGAFIEKGWA
jgi:hypothetical protein